MASVTRLYHLVVWTGWTLLPLSVHLSRTPLQLCEGMQAPSSPSFISLHDPALGFIVLSADDDVVLPFFFFAVCKSECTLLLFACGNLDVTFFASDSVKWLNMPAFSQRSRSATMLH